MKKTILILALVLGSASQALADPNAGAPCYVEVDRADGDGFDTYPGTRYDFKCWYFYLDDADGEWYRDWAEDYFVLGGWVLVDPATGDLELPNADGWDYGCHAGICEYIPPERHDELRLADPVQCSSGTCR